MWANVRKKVIGLKMRDSGNDKFLRLVIYLTLLRSVIGQNIDIESSWAERGDEDVRSVLAVEGGRADLPCDISAPAAGDSVYLVLWYRKDSSAQSGTPIYSYDSRQGEGVSSSSSSSGSADMWSEPTAFGDRAFFRTVATPAVLSVTGVQRFDDGYYTCRVDFRQSPTVYHHVKLDVIVPPQKPLITDERGRQVVDSNSALGPFRAGDSLSLECHVPGGNPLPKVLWYMGEHLYDATYQQTYQGTVKNSMTVQKLERKHTQTVFRCLASNNNFTLPVESAVRIKMLFPPQAAKIEAPAQPLTSGREYYIACKTWGSNPPARIEWYRAGNDGDLRPLDAYNQTVIDGGNVTVGWLRFRPGPEDHLQTVSCRGSNDEMLSQGTQIVEDYLKLEVYFPPTVSLSLGRTLNPRDIEEGDDIYFTCAIKANPQAYKLTWWLNGEEVVHDVANGVIVSNQSLVLQKVTRQQAGSYTCEASNVEGDQVSRPVTVTIMYKPICLGDQKTIYGVSDGEAAHISCRVDSYPEANSFSWSFNTSSGGSDLSPKSHTDQGSASLLTYTPRSQMDYGTVLCWASNNVGRQVVPCVFHVIPASPPDPPKNCTMTNQTQDSLQVDCVHGFSSGLKQEFHMEVFSHPEHHLLVNITARSPRLLARGLPPDSSLFLRLYASNVKGRSRSVTFDGYTLRMAEKQTVMDAPAELETPKEGWSLLTVMLLGVVITLVIFAFVVTLIAKLGRPGGSGPGGAPVGGPVVGGSNGNGGNPGGMVGMVVRGGGGTGTSSALNSVDGSGNAMQMLGNGKSHHHHMHLQSSAGNTLINKAFQENNAAAAAGSNGKNPDLIPHFNSSSSPASTGNTNQQEFPQQQIHLNRRSGDAANLFNFNKANNNSTASTLPSQQHQLQPQQKDTNHLMRQQQQQHLLMQQQQQQHLYSPAAASDSSGFSERDSSVVSASGFPTMVVHPRNTFSPGHFNNQAAPDLTRSGSPSFFSYQNPALSASPYSTLPRRPPNTSNGGTPGLHSPGALRVNPNFNRPRGIVPPLSLELPSSRPLMPEPAAAFNGRTFQTAKSSTLPPAMPMSTAAANQKVTHKITARTPLLEDDRESCV